MKYPTYENAKSYLYNKDVYTQKYIDTMLNRTQRMFTYKNLPNSLPQFELEKLLQINGFAIIAKVENNIYAFNAGLGGILNEYYEPTKAVVSNPFLKLSKEYDIDSDCVLMRNDTMMSGLLPILAKNSVINCDCEITLDMLCTVLRVQYLISASDDKTRNNAEVFLNKIKNGDYSVIGDSQFFDGVKFQSFNGNSQLITQFIQLMQYVKASSFNDIGINANFNMKKERLITTELNINEPSLIPLSENMLDCRKSAVEKINKMFNLNIEVELNCIWKEQSDIHEKDALKTNEKIENGKDKDDSDNVTSDSNINANSSIDSNIDNVNDNGVSNE